MPEYALKELLVFAAVATLVAAWIKLMRQKGDPRLIAACGLLAYFLPIAGPLAALGLLNVYDRRMYISYTPRRESAATAYTWSRQNSG